jgi:hypothetical protein
MASRNTCICSNGHRYSKSSARPFGDCPVCPICEATKPTEGDLPKLAAPARRALEGAGVFSLAQLAAYSEMEVAEWHGMGPNALGKLREALQQRGLIFKEK